MSLSHLHSPYHNPLKNKGQSPKKQKEISQKHMSLSPYWPNIPILFVNKTKTALDILFVSLEILRILILKSKWKFELKK